MLHSDKDTAVPSTTQDEDPSPVLNEHVEDQVAAEDAAQLDSQDEGGTTATDAVQPSAVIDHYKLSDTEVDQCAKDGQEPSANRQNVSDMPDGPETSRTFSIIRKTVVPLRFRQDSRPRLNGN